MDGAKGPHTNSYRPMTEIVSVKSRELNIFFSAYFSILNILPIQLTQCADIANHLKCNGVSAYVCM